MAWVVCHSFGNEQVDLSPTETTVARALAAAGDHVLRFHCRGYGDASDLQTPPGPATQANDVVDAVRQLRALVEPAQVGAIGARLGAAVALLAVDRAELARLALVSPVVEGRRYVAELLRFQRMGELTAGEKGTVDDLRARLAADGWINVQGWRLHQHVSEELEALDLAASGIRFEGGALVVQVSSGEKVQESITRFAAALEAGGARVQVRVVADAAAPNFGYEHFRPVSSTHLEDSLRDLNRSLAAAVVAWAARDRPAPEATRDVAS